MEKLLLPVLAVLTVCGCDLIPEPGSGGPPRERPDGSSGEDLRPITSVENDMLDLFNMERATMGKPMLLRAAGLDAIVLDYTREMAGEHHLGHTDHAGRDSEGRARYFSGDDTVRCLEIVQWWGGTPSGQVHYDGFRASEQHHMAYLEQGIYDLGPTMHVGVAVVAGTGPEGTMFAGRGGSYAAAMLCDRSLDLIIDPAEE